MYSTLLCQMLFQPPKSTEAALYKKLQRMCMLQRVVDNLIHLRVLTGPQEKVKNKYGRELFYSLKNKPPEAVFCRFFEPSILSRPQS